MIKEIHDINARAVDFVVELIDYIFEYPDDDYMTMECLCRKLVKHGLLDKADGYYQTHEIRTNTHECVKDTHDKTENSSEKPNNCEDLQDWKDRMWAEAIVTEPTISKMEQVEEEPQTSKIIEAYSRGYADGANTMRQTFVADGIVFAKMDEPQTDLVNDSQDLVKDLVKDEPQTDCAWR